MNETKPYYPYYILVLGPDPQQNPVRFLGPYIKEAAAITVARKYMEKFPDEEAQKYTCTLLQRNNVSGTLSTVRKVSFPPMLLDAIEYPGVCGLYCHEDATMLGVLADEQSYHQTLHNAIVEYLKEKVSPFNYCNFLIRRMEVEVSGDIVVEYEYHVTTTSARNRKGSRVLANKRTFYIDKIKVL